MKRGCLVAAIVGLVCVTAFALPGGFDTSFNGSGIAVADFSGTGTLPRATGVAVDGLGRIVAAGEVTVHGMSARDIAVARFNPDGTPDTLLNGTGKFTHNFGGDDRVVGVAVDALDRIIVAGTTNFNPGCTNQGACGGNDNFFAARFTASGVLDTSFGSGGHSLIGFNSDDDIAWDMIQDPLGRILIVGTKEDDGGYLGSAYGVIAMARLNGDGTLDTSFDGDGRLVSDVAGPQRWSVARAVTLDRHGRILIGADVGLWPYVFRYGPDGVLEGGGYYQAPFIETVGGTNCDYTSIDAVAVDARDRIVAAGRCTNNSSILIFRALDNGDFDLTFGPLGWVVLTDFTTAAGDQNVEALSVDGLGRITIAGFGNECATDMFLARYAANGELDFRFGPNASGWMRFGVQSQPCSDDRAYAMTVDADGDFVVAGFTRSSAGFQQFAVARVLTEHPDFFFTDPIAPINVAPGSTAATNVTINSVDGFSEPLKISPHAGIPDGFSFYWEGYGDLFVTLPPYGSVRATIQVTVSDLVPPGQYVLRFFDERFPQHAADIVVNVGPTMATSGELVARFESAGYIDNAGFAERLSQMLESAEDSRQRGDLGAAINKLAALKSSIEAQAGKHVATSAVENGVAFSPTGLLIATVDALIHQLSTP